MNIRLLLLILLLAASNVLAGSGWERGVSLQAMPKNLSVGQAAAWILEGTCLTPTVDPANARQSSQIMQSPVDYSRFSLRDYVSIDTALLLIVPRQVSLVVDRERGLATFTLTNGGAL